MRKWSLALLCIALAFLSACDAGGGVSCRVVSYVTTYREICEPAGKYGEDCTTYPATTPIYSCVAVPTDTPRR